MDTPNNYDIADPRRRTGCRMITPQTIIQRISGNLETKTNNGRVLFTPELKYVSLDETAGRVWDLLDAPTQVATLIHSLAADFDIPYEQCTNDLLPFLQDMTNLGVIQAVPDQV